MGDALVGYSGFVGSILRKQRSFDALYRSANIHEIVKQSFGTVVCSAAPAQKWIANRQPDIDLRNIESLCDRLSSVRCETLILISTVDVFKIPINVDESTVVDLQGLHAYGKHRHLLEDFVRKTFPGSLIVRLPGLVGPGLKKNVVFDILHSNNMAAIDSRSMFQFYPMTNLWYDIVAARDAGLKLVHLTAEPISVNELARDGFGIAFDQLLDSAPPSYDFRSKHAHVLGGQDMYNYSKRETIAAVRAYAQTELKTPNHYEMISQ